MNVKTFRGLREHPRGRPLRGPETDPREQAFIAPDKFAERAAMPLRINRARKNLHAGNPGFANLRRRFDPRPQFSGLDAAPASCCENVRARNRASTSAACASAARPCQSCLSGVLMDRNRYLPNEKSARSRERFGL